MTEIPMTGSRGQPLKIAQHLADGKRLVEAVEALRAARDAASAEEPVTERSQLKPDCNKRTKRKSYPLPPLDRPSVIPGFPLRDPAGQDMPNYGSIEWAPSPSTRATQAERRGKRAPMKPVGSSELRKKPK
jgi:hypothetical protein